MEHVAQHNKRAKNKRRRCASKVKCKSRTHRTKTTRRKKQRLEFSSSAFSTSLAASASFASPVSSSALSTPQLQLQHRGEQHQQQQQQQLGLYLYSYDKISGWPRPTGLLSEHTLRIHVQGRVQLLGVHLGTHAVNIVASYVWALTPCRHAVPSLSAFPASLSSSSSSSSSSSAWSFSKPVRAVQYVPSMLSIVLENNEALLPLPQGTLAEMPVWNKLITAAFPPQDAFLSSPSAAAVESDYARFALNIATALLLHVGAESSTTSFSSLVSSAPPQQQQALTLGAAIAQLRSGQTRSLSSSKACGCTCVPMCKSELHHILLERFVDALMTKPDMRFGRKPIKSATLEDGEIPTDEVDVECVARDIRAASRGALLAANCLPALVFGIKTEHASEHLESAKKVLRLCHPVFYALFPQPLRPSPSLSSKDEHDLCDWTDE